MQLDGSERLSLFSGQMPLLLDVPLIEVLEFLIANRLHQLPDVEAQREQVELLRIIQDYAPRGVGGDPKS
jgi:hypothetical protein